MASVAGKVALITGGARGLGAAAARRLAEHGASVLITDVLDEDGRRTADGLAEEGHKVVFAHHDVTREEDWARVVRVAETELGGLDVLVNNAGVGSEGIALTDLSLSDWRKVTRVNLDGVFLGIKHGVPLMRKSAHNWPGGGSIINISSVLGIVGFANAGPYCASKGGVRLLTKSAALELAQDGSDIRVNSVHPGFTETQMVSKGIADMAATGEMGGENELKQLITSMHPIGRMGVPDDIAGAIFFLASDASAFMTGTELVVDGGYISQ